MRSIIVEDDPVMRTLLLARLTARGHEVICFEDAASAWAELERHPAPLIVLDWMLPGAMDGLDLCRRLRSRPDGAYSYVLVITARDDGEALTAVLDAGADDYLAKPLERAMLHVRLTVAERGARGRMAQQRAERARRDAEQRLWSVLWRAPVAAFIADEDGTILSSDGQLVPRLVDTDGPPPRSLLELGAGTLLQADELRRARTGETVTRAVSLDGGDVEIQLTRLVDERSGAEHCIGVFVQDISAPMGRVRRAESFALDTRATLDLYASALVRMHACVLLVEPNGEIDHISPGGFALLGIDPDVPSRPRWVDAVALPRTIRSSLEGMRQHPAERRTPVLWSQPLPDGGTRMLRMAWVDLEHEDRMMLLCSVETQQSGASVLDEPLAAPPSERSRILDALRQCDGNRKRAALLLGISRATLYRRLHTLGIADRLATGA